MQAAGRSNLKRVSLELGGKSPLIIFEDADCKSNVYKTHCSLCVLKLGLDILQWNKKTCIVINVQNVFILWFLYDGKNF